jgi:signal transduction histidine kinase
MKASMRPRQARLAAARGLRWVLLALCAACSGCEDPGTDHATALTRGEVLEAGSDYPRSLPASDASWKPVVLPDNWDSRRPGYQGYVWYRFRFPGLGAPEERRALYLPTAGMNAEVLVNGLRLGSQGRMQMPPTRHFYTPLLFELPQAAAVGSSAQNEVLVLVAGFPSYHSGLGAAYVGPHDSLYGAWRWRGFWQNTGTLATCVFNIALGAYVLLLWWGERRREARDALGWFGAALVVWGLRNLNLVVTEPPVPDLLWALLTVAGAAAFTGLFSLFAMRLAEQEDPAYHAPRWLGKAIGVYIGVALVFFVSSPSYQLANAGFVPLSLIGVSLTLWSVWRLTRLAWRRRTRPLILVAVAGAIYVVLLMRDFSIAADAHGLGRYFLRQYAAVPLFAAIALLLARRYFEALSQARELSASLQSQVAAQRLELQRRFDRLREVERYQTLMQERARLTRDLHDSLGMHLVSALRQVRRGSATGAEALAGTLQDCLDDLRVVIDSLDVGERDPLVVLGTLRFRLAPRFEAMGVRLDWRIDAEGVEWPALEPATTLELLRIVQEALTNALKHSGASVVTLAVEVDERALIVMVIDNGRGRNPRADEVAKPGTGAEAAEEGRAGRGRGLRNMHSRAERIGGRWSMACTTEGCTVRLELPRSDQAVAASANLPAPSPPD